LKKWKSIIRFLPFSKKITNQWREKKRHDAPVQLNDFIQIGGIFTDSASMVIESLRKVPSNSLLEHGELYPLFYNSNASTLELLGLLIKEVRPRIVIETGVANGVSTRKILRSFEELGLVDSKLFSLDIDPRVATPELLSFPQFNFVPVDPSNSFLNTIKSINEVDIFYHDSDHSYDNQMLEYCAAWEILNSEKGVLLSDDVNWSNAFLDFCKKVNRVPFLLSDGGKFAGVICR
jgi:predicted O-methyltransferase YrrM